MSSTWGNALRLSLFGESHGAAVGVVIDNLPPGLELDLAAIQLQMERRAPGTDRWATPRKESDLPEILSGFYQGRTTGTPLCVLIRNQNTRSADYGELGHLPRPSHGDYPGFLRYQGFQDPRGGGHFSGRLTAPLVFAGAVCRQILEQRHIAIGAHIYAIGGIADTPLDPVSLSPQQIDALSWERFGVLSAEAREKMQQAIEDARCEQDSLGGVIECAVTGLPAGWGSPHFGGVENRLAALLYGIPAVKGVEFGAGFAFASMRGSEANDVYEMEAGNVRTKTNHNGGILGGITTGMPLIFRVAIKPTPSIARPQQTVDLATRQNAQLTIQGRHDPCIVPRAVPVVESVAAIALLDLMMEAEKL